MKSTVLSIILLCSMYISGVAKNISISGYVFDEDENPIDYAIVAIQNQRDSTIFTSCQTKDGGKFVLSSPTNKANIIISYIGYETSVIPITCFADTTLNVTLKENSRMLEEVMVVGHRPSIKMTSEGILTLVQNTALSNSGTAIDVLENIPLVQRTSDGFYVFGKGTPIIYVNGHRVYDLSELDGLKSQDIKNVELITNPGVKYDASVSSVIKITKVTHTDNIFALDNRTSLIQSNFTGAVEQLSINFRNHKLNLYNTIKISTAGKSDNKTANQTVTSDTIWEYITNQIESSRKQSYENTLNIDFNITQSHLIGCQYVLNFTPTYKLNINSNSQITANQILYDSLDNNGYNQFIAHPTHRLNFYYNGQIKNWKLEYDFNFLRRYGTTNSLSNETSNLSYNQTVTSNNKIISNLISSKFILSHPLLGGNLNMGLDYIFTNRLDKYANLNNIVKSSEIRMKEQRINPFFEFNRIFSFGLFNWGIRYEHTTTDYTITGIKNDLEGKIYNQLFPYLSFSSKINSLQWQISYNTRSQRPSYSQLSSNVMYVNRFTLQTGNPFLKPEYIHSISLQGLWKFLQFNIEYQDKRNAIIYWATQDLNQESITTISYKNMNSIKRLSSTLSFFYNIGVWNPRLTLGYNKQFLNLKTSNGIIGLNKPLFYTQIVNSFKLPSSFSLIINANFQSKGNYQNVYLSKNIFYLDLNLIKTFSKGKYALQLKINDMFKSMKDGNTIFNDKMTMNLVNSYDSRKVTLTFRYQFNSIKNKERRNSFVENEINRL